MAYRQDGKFSAEDFESREAIDNLSKPLQEDEDTIYILEHYNKNDSEGFTPLCFAVTNSVRPDIIVYLVNYKHATVGKVCNKGKTPLQMACIAGNSDAVRVLLGDSTNKIDDITHEPIDTNIKVDGEYKTDAAGNILPVRDENGDIVYRKINKIPLPLNEGKPFDNKNRQYCLLENKKFSVPPENTSSWIINKITYKYDDGDEKVHSPMRDIDGNPIKQCDKNGKEIHKKDDSGKELRNKFEYIWDYEYLPEYQQLYVIETCSISSSASTSKYDICEAAKLKSSDVLRALMYNSNGGLRKLPSDFPAIYDNDGCTPLYFATIAQCYDSLQCILDNTSKNTRRDRIDNDSDACPSSDIIEDRDKRRTAYEVAIDSEDVGALEIFNKYVTTEDIAKISIRNETGLYGRLLDDLYDCFDVYFIHANDTSYTINKMYYELYNHIDLSDGGKKSANNMQRIAFLKKFSTKSEFVNYVDSTYVPYNSIVESPYNAKRRVAPFIDAKCYAIIKSLYDSNKLNNTDKSSVSTKAAKRNNLDIMELVDKPSVHRWGIWPTYNNLIDDKYYVAINYAYENDKPDDLLDYTKIVRLINENVNDSTSETGLCIGILSNQAIIKGTDLPPFKKIIDRFYIADTDRFKSAYKVLYEDTLWNKQYKDKLEYILSKAYNDDDFAVYVNNNYISNRFLDGFIDKRCYKIINILYDNGKLNSGNIEYIKTRAMYPHSGSHGADYLKPQSFEIRWGLWPDIMNIVDNCQSSEALSDLIYMHNNGIISQSDKNYITAAVDNYRWNQDPDHQSDPLYPKSPAINPANLTDWPWW